MTPYCQSLFIKCVLLAFCWTIVVLELYFKPVLGQSISTSDSFACRLTSNAVTVECWGGFVYRSSPSVSSPFANVATSVGAGGGCALRANGTVHCFGDMSTTILLLPSSTQKVEHLGITAVAHTPSTNSYLCTQTETQIDCWGPHVPAVLLVDLPLMVPPSSKWLDFSVSDQSLCARDNTTRLWCIGTTAYGLRNQTAEFLTGWYSVSHGGTFVCGLDIQGRARCFGQSNVGQLNVPPTERFLQVVAMANTVACGLTLDDRQPLCWGQWNVAFDGTSPALAFSIASTTSVVTSTTWLQLGGGTGWHGSNTITLCGVNMDGSVFCMGNGNQIATPAATYEPCGLGSGSCPTVALGSFFGCGLRKGSKSPVCWGDNSYNQLNAPFRYSEMVLAEEDGGRSSLLACGLRGCFLYSHDTQVLTQWGNSFVSPVSTSYEGLYQLVGSPVAFHTCAILQDFTCAQEVQRSAGLPVSGDQLGHRLADRLRLVECWNLPATIPASFDTLDNATLLAVGYSAVCGVVTNNVSSFVRCVGTGPMAHPPLISDPSIEILACGYDHCCVRTSSSLVCWGSNNNGQLNVPPAYANVDLLDLVAEKQITCVLLLDTSIGCWGWASAMTTVYVRANLGLKTNYARIVLGYQMLCGVFHNGTVDTCWTGPQTDSFGQPSQMLADAGGLAPPGFFSQIGHQFALCPSGRYSVGWGALTDGCAGPIAEGYYGTDNQTAFTSQPFECPLGHYCPLASVWPTPCPPGTFGGSTGLTISECSGLTPPGYYSLDGTAISTQYPCPPGTYGDTGGATSPACSGGCSPGFYCPLGSTRATMLACANSGTGVYCPANSSLPQLVSSGYYSSPDASSQLVCPPGSSCVGGQRRLCVLGSYSSIDAQTVCALANPGTYISSVGATSLEYCLDGAAQPSNGQSSCPSCPAGTYASDDHTKCVPCSPGTFSTGNVTSCSDCGWNRYQSLVGQDMCLDCPTTMPPSFTTSNRSASCASCPITQIQTQKMLCVDCPAGSAPSSNTNYTTCEPCAAGTFAASSGMATCVTCSTGSYTAQHGQTTCLSCDAYLGKVSCVNGQLDSVEGYYLRLTNSSSDLYVTRCSPAMCGPHKECLGPNRLPYDENPLCGSCLPGYTESDGVCVECTRPRPDWIFLMCFVLVMYVGVTHLLSNGAPRTGACSSLFYFAQVGWLMCGAVSPLLNWMSIFTLNGTHVTSFCLWPMDPYEKLYLNFAFPLASIVVLMVLFMSHTCLFKGCGVGKAGKSGDPLLLVVDNEDAPSCQTMLLYRPRNYLRTLLLLLLWSYQQLVSTLMQLWFCVDVAPDVSVLAMNPAISCTTDTYRQAFRLSVGLSVGTLVGLLMFFNYVYRRHQNHEFVRGTGAITILSEPYQPSLYLWEFVVLLRRTTIMLIHTILYLNPVWQYILLSLTHGIILLMHVLQTPYRSDVDTKIESVALGMLPLISLLLAALYATTASVFASTSVQITLFFLWPVPVLCLLGWFSYGRLVVLIRWCTTATNNNKNNDLSLSPQSPRNSVFPPMQSLP